MIIFASSTLLIVPKKLQSSMSVLATCRPHETINVTLKAPQSLWNCETP